MHTYKFYHNIQIRFSDLDTQWHVNNARFVSFLEEARLAYYRHLKLFEGESFFDLPLIVADIHITYLAPISLHEKIKVGARVKRLGNKSLEFEFEILSESGEVKARSENVMVAYDYHQKKTITLDEKHRKIIAAFEGIEPGPTAR